MGSETYKNQRTLIQGPDLDQHNNMVPKGSQKKERPYSSAGFADTYSDRFARLASEIHEQLQDCVHKLSGRCYQGKGEETFIV